MTLCGLRRELKCCSIGARRLMKCDRVVCLDTWLAWLSDLSLASSLPLFRSSHVDSLSIGPRVSCFAKAWSMM
jgi:hypothetical protein